MFTFLHAADLHLDSPLVNLARYEGAPVDEVRRAGRRALENLVGLALEREAHFLLLCGDLFDGDWRDFDTALFFRRQMLRLHEAGIPVFMIAGNHDAQSRITKSLSLPDNVHAFRADRPETMFLDDVRVALHGQSFDRPAVVRDLSADYPLPESGHFNIGLLHTALTGREGHEPYAPCTLEGLRAKGYDYWALGHAHQHEVASREPWVVFPGVLQGRNIRETGPKGCVVVEVDDSGSARAEFQALDVFRWESCTVDAGGAVDGWEVVDRARKALEEVAARNQGLPVAVRVEITGECAAHAAMAADPEQWVSEVRAAGQDAGPDQVWIEKVRLATDDECAAKAAQELDEGPLAELAVLVRELMADDAALVGAAGCLQDLYKALPADFRRSRPEMSPEDPAWLREILGQAQALLKERLLAGEGA